MDVAQPSDGLSPRPPGRSMIGDLMWTYLAILIGLPGGFAVDLGMRQLGVVYDGGLSFPLFAIVIGPVTVLVVVLAIGPHPPRTLVRLVGGGSLHRGSALGERVRPIASAPIRAGPGF